MTDKLETYHKKRRFESTPEPSGKRSAPAKAASKTTGRKAASGATTRGKQARTTNTTSRPRNVKRDIASSASSSTARRKRAQPALGFVIQEHHARRLHYDFRLELDGTLKSWAIPKGPCLDPAVKRLAVHVEDHPIEYGTFEGQIPEGNYGAGSVVVWDRGTWAPEGDIDALEAYKAGKLKFTLAGEKLHGGWALVRSHMRGSGDKEQWLLIKERDDEARPESDYDVIAERPGSVLDMPRSKAGARARASTRGSTRGSTRASASARAPADASVRKRATQAHASKADRPDLITTRSTDSLLELAHHPDIEGAVKARLPQTFKPQLATLVETPPTSSDWSYEIKFDGYRVITRIDHAAGKPRVQIFTRTGNDWTAKFGKLPLAFAHLPLDEAWLDGEAVVLDAHGLPNFQALQNAFDAARPQDIVIYLFDMPFLNGYDLRQVPLAQRRALLHALIGDAEPRHLRFSEDFAFDADTLLKSACDMALEGIIGKRIDSPYTSTRSPNWIKLKCRRRQEFVIGGYTEPAGSRTAFGALLLGVYDDKGKLQYAGRVGTGFDAKTLRDIKAKLDRHASRTMPFATAPSERSRTPVHWVKPELVAECHFAEWTQERIVRQAAFISLRTDKPARRIVHETPVGANKMTEPLQETEKPSARRAASRQATPGDDDSGSTSAASKKLAPAPRGARSRTTAPAARSGETRVAGVRVTHPERVIDKQSQATKLDLVQYYASVADRMLVELKDRPIALVRAPEDIGGELFFQKHNPKHAIAGITQHPNLDPGHPAVMSIDTIEALVGAAQMNTVEIHTWNALAAAIDKPDRVVFDLDPDPSLGWDAMIEAAQLTHALLDELGIRSFCKTSGGKGVHLVVPLERRAPWDDVYAFAEAVAAHMATTLPDRFSAKMGPQNRKKKIFIDYLRNHRGSTTVATWSARARPGLGVSVPIAWSELAQTTAGDQWNIFNLHQRLESLKADPWEDYANSHQRLTAEMKKRLGLKARR